MKRPKPPPPSPVENDTAPEAPPESLRPPSGGVFFSLNLGDFLRDQMRPGYPLRDVAPRAPNDGKTDGELLQDFALHVLDKESGLVEQRKRQARKRRAKKST